MDRVGDLERYLLGRPGDRFALYALGLELAKVGRTAEAEARLRELVALYPASGAGHLQLGRLLAAAGRADAAGDAWRSGLAALAGRSDAESVRSTREIEAELTALED